MYKRLIPFTVIAFQIAGALHLQPVIAQASIPAEKLNPYSEIVLKTMLDSCYGGVSSMTLNVPLSRKVGETAQQLINKSFAKIQKDAIQQEQVLDAQVQQKLVQLRMQVKDKKKLQVELKKVEDIIATGKLNGQAIEPEQLEFLKKSRDDLKKLSQDPNYIEVMAKKQQTQELEKIKTQLESAQQKMTACGCVATTLQKQYTEQEFLRRSIEELQSGPAISKDWQSALQICKAPKSN